MIKKTILTTALFIFGFAVGIMVLPFVPFLVGIAACSDAED